MNEDAKQMREFCHKWIVKLRDKQDPLDDKKTRDTMVALLHDMHIRLTLLEGVDPRSLEDIPV